jgi:hypothetical protein
MIIVKLMGGLGNQMFQYAFGKTLALKNKTELKLDVSSLGDTKTPGIHTIRYFQLDLYNINAAIASAEDLKKYKKGKAGKLLNMFLFYLPFKIQNLYIREPFFYFFKKGLNVPSNSYMDGYWQSEKYFNTIREELIREFTPAGSLSAQTMSLAEKIRSVQSVSIHVRRGDYVADPLNIKRFEVCSKSYYKQAMSAVTEKVSDPSFFIFSDEPEWFKKNIQTTFPVEYVTHNTGSNSYEDMYLMSLCKHNIIANSSFSWWAAWLNKNKEKIVIAPKRWFKDNSKNSKDLLPETWMKL